MNSFVFTISYSDTSRTSILLASISVGNLLSHEEASERIGAVTFSLGRTLLSRRQYHPRRRKSPDPIVHLLRGRHVESTVRGGCPQPEEPTSVIAQGRAQNLRFGEDVLVSFRD